MILWIKNASWIPETHVQKSRKETEEFYCHMKLKQRRVSRPPKSLMGKNGAVSVPPVRFGRLSPGEAIKLYREAFEFARCFTGICPLAPVLSQILTLAGIKASLKRETYAPLDLPDLPGLLNDLRVCVFSQSLSKQLPGSGSPPISLCGPDL
jgi:hypothetical protein